MKEISVNLNDIKENEDNPRVITERNLDKLTNSLLIFPKMMNVRPIVVNEDIVILGGNMRFKALSRIFTMTDEEIRTNIQNKREKRKMSKIESQQTANYWIEWKKEPICVVLVGELGLDEEEQFIIKDNISVGEWDTELLQNFEQEDLEDWGVETWGEVETLVEFDNTPAPLSTPAANKTNADRLRIIVTYDRSRKEEMEAILGKELTRPNFKLEDLI